MVSLRRRRLLGLSVSCTGVEYESENVLEDALQSSNGVHPPYLYDLNISAEDVNDDLNIIARDGNNDPSEKIGTPNELPNHVQPSSSGLTLSNEPNNQPRIGIEVKRRKQHRRRRINNKEEENSDMTGVYRKNGKYQAAIKVEAKQIHLGTFSSIKEAAHLYDRAAYMCNRAPNIELSKEEKQELDKLSWDEFLAITRRDIAAKRRRRGCFVGPVQPSDGSSTSASDGS